ncbi:uncharacterized protein LOC119661430 [Hermetia illucens]|nr:uncharacterized protein LOC119661430 [Hermetia illucens]
MGESPKEKIMHMRDVAQIVMYAKKFQSAIEKPKIVLPDRDNMRLQFMAATAPIPQKTRPPKLLIHHVRPNPVEEVEEEISEVSSDVSMELAYYDRKQKDLEKFYQQLIYDLPKSPKTSKRIEELARPKRQDLISTYHQYRKVLDPLGRKKRIKRRVTEMTAMTTEELEQYLKQQENKKEDERRRRRKRRTIYRQMLKKLEQQCREKFLDDAFDKFSKYLANCTIGMEGITEICPANVQRLVNCIQYNICQTCKVTAEDHKVNGPLYKGIATCVSWLIVEVLYNAQSTKEEAVFLGKEDVPQELKAQWEDTPDTLKKRAMIAARKKQGGAKQALYRGPAPKMEDLLKLSKLIGCR